MIWFDLYACKSFYWIYLAEKAISVVDLRVGLLLPPPLSQSCCRCCCLNILRCCRGCCLNSHRCCRWCCLNSLRCCRWCCLNSLRCCRCSCLNNLCHWCNIRCSCQMTMKGVELQYQNISMKLQSIVEVLKIKLKIQGVITNPIYAWIFCTAVDFLMESFVYQSIFL